MADGIAETKEIKQIEKLYTALGLDKSTIASNIHALSVSAAKPLQMQPLPVSKNDKGVAEKLDTSILDSAILKLHESETSDVQSLLGTIFANS
ncbi:hypothetical protein BHC44_05695 [Snodgrassella alvi]|jgi:hypothetical protein|uniref:Uncharacterized protein n=1 Tax=Snodgrassella alvi TaxID=1196083 RepID=A0A2N9XXQ5_9NEIS|nr:hypothetical protein [Snodgrassella alvi]PIT53445.1 hypothetical protein BHC44_05695 [Snodgrassella alvi]PIT54850.1 hypothetical protein BHC49_07515 [Snodgrassella alvi]